MGALNLEYVIAEDRYYLVSLDRTDAIPLPRRLHCSLTELGKPHSRRTRLLPFGRDLVPWPPKTTEEA